MPPHSSARGLRNCGITADAADSHAVPQFRTGALARGDLTVQFASPLKASTFKAPQRFPSNSAYLKRYMGPRSLQWNVRQYWVSALFWVAARLALSK